MAEPPCASATARTIVSPESRALARAVPVHAGERLERAVEHVLR